MLLIILQFSQVIGILQAENIDVSAGTQNMEEDLIELELFISLQLLKKLIDIILVSNQQQRVTLGDIARLNLDMKTASSVAKVLEKMEFF